MAGHSSLPLRERIRATLGDEVRNLEEGMQ
jgi:hypothetical protein